MRASFSIPLVASCLASLAATSLSGDARAVGEADADGFPSYEERVGSRIRRGLHPRRRRDPR